MILSDFAKALAQSFDARFQAVLWTSIAITIATLFALTAAVGWGLGWLVGDSVTLPLIGPIEWAGALASWAGIGVMLVASIFLLVPVASAVTGLFLETVAQAVEDKHYPTLPPAPGISAYQAFRDSVNFLGVVIAVNAVALIVYFLSGPAAPLVFWAVNGFLLGREYFQLVAMRRLGRPGARALRKRNAGAIWLAGTLMAIPLTVPVLNLVIPILGVATFTHMFHRINRQTSG